MQISREIRHEIRSLLIPHVTTPDERLALVRNAFFGSPLADEIPVENMSAADFSSVLVDETLAYGDIAPDEPALIALLDEISLRTGEDKQPQIAAIVNWVTNGGLETEPTPIIATDEPEQLPWRDSGGNNLLLPNQPIVLRIGTILAVTLVMTLIIVFTATQNYEALVWVIAFVAILVTAFLNLLQTQRGI